MKKNSLTLLISVACFTLGSENLSAVDYYVTQASEPGTSDSCANCTTPGNNCCTFLDAVNQANSVSGTIHITVPTVTYTGTVTSPCNAGTMTIESDVGGSVIDFNGQGTSCTSCITSLPDVFQIGGTVTLTDVVFQNSHSGSNTISFCGGTLVVNGTSVNSGADPFSGNAWTLNNTPSQNLTFGATGDYTQPFLGDFTFPNTNAAIDLTSNDTGTVTVGSNFNQPGGFNRTALNIFAPNGGTIVFSNTINVKTVQINSGIVELMGSSNNITILNLIGGTTYLSSNGSPGAGSVIEMLGGILSFLNSFTLGTSSQPLQLRLAGENIIDDNGNNIQIDRQILSAGGSAASAIYAKKGSGVQALTATTNAWTAGTNLYAGALSINNVLALGGTAPISFKGGSLFASTALTLPSTITTIASVSGGGFAAAGSTTFEISSNVTGSGTLNIGLYNTYVTGSGTVTFNNPIPANNTFSGEIVVGALDGSNNPYPATFSLANLNQIGSVSGLTLQGGGIFETTTTLSTLTLPITISTGGGTLSAGSATTLTVPGSIASSGTGSITLSIGGGNNVVLSGDNSSFAGNISVIESSTLSVGATDNLGIDSSSYSLSLNTGTLDVTGNITSARGLSLTGANTMALGTNSLSFSGDVTVASGSSLTKTGTGTLSVLPPNTGTGNSYDLNIVAGDVISNTNFLDGAAITVAGGSTVTFDQTVAGVFNGSITGAGSVSITGSALITFNPSTHSYSGGTSLSGLVAISGDVFGASGSTLTSNGGTIETTSSFSLTNPITLTGDLTVDTTISQDIFQLTGEISGPGRLIKEGLGVLYLTAHSNYTGKTLVNAGTLVVNGDISSSPDPIVAVGAALTGTGTVGDTDVFGRIKGGNPTGTLHVLGTLVMESGSEFLTAATPLDATLVAVTGTVTIDPSTSYFVAVVPGFYNNYSKVVLSGSSISGQFDGFHANSTFSSLTYTPTEVILSISSPVQFAATGNALQTAKGLQGAIDYNRIVIQDLISSGTVVDIPSLDSLLQIPHVLESLIPFTKKTGLNYALNELHPAQLKGLTITQENNAVRVRESMSQRILNELDRENCLSPHTKDPQGKECCDQNKKTFTAWIAGLGDTLVQNTKTNAYGPLTGYRSNTGGVVTGFDTFFADHFYAGAVGAYTGSHLHFENGKGKGNIRSGYAGVYLSALGSGNIGKIFYANASILGSWSDYDVDRHIEYAAVNLTAKSSHGGNQILSHLDTGLNFDWWGLNVRTFDSFDYMSQVERGYCEHNAGEWELTVSRKNATMIRNELGVQFSRCFCFCSSKWILSPKFSWVREVRIKGETFNVNFTQGGSPFVIHGYFPDRSLIAPGLALTGSMLNDSLLFDLYYNGEFKGSYSSNSYGGQIGYSF